MTRLSFVLMLMACAGMSISSVFAQDAGVNNGTVESKMTNENISQNPQEHWYNLALMNTKIGYMHITSDKTEYQGEEVDRHKIDIVMNFKALGTDITLEITRVEWTGSDLMPRHFLSTSNESGLKQVEGTYRRRHRLY